jgi:hypothetical protein
MSDPRPRPQYGEYATPEEVAALRGTPAAAPVSAPASPAEPVRVPGRVPAPGARRFDRRVTIALLAFGVINLVQYAAPLLDFANALDVAMASTPYGAIDFGEPVRVGGLVILAVTTVLLVGASILSIVRLRRGRIAFWVPLTAGALSAATWVIVLTVALLQTPGALTYPGS